MSLNVTITDIAKQLNTTAATVSRALNNHPSISLERKQEIRELAAKLKYRHNKIASSLRLGQSGIIGVLIPSAEINFFGSVVHGIENMAAESGYNVLIYQTNESQESEVKGIETLLNARVDGIMVSIAKNTTNYDHFKMVKNLNIPIVFFDRAKDNLGIHSVVINDYKGAYIATEHLIEQGYTRIAHISGPGHIQIFNERKRGYTDALIAHGFDINNDYIIEGNVSIEAGREATKKLMKLTVPPDGFFAVEDFTALGVLKQLNDFKIKVPEQAGVIGFANENFGEHISPTLSSIDQQTVTMGNEAFRLFKQLKQADINENTREQRIVLDPIAILRKSSLKRSI
jgi:LacI family transcriptional regulator